MKQHSSKSAGRGTSHSRRSKGVAGDSAKKSAGGGFTAEERAAMREYALERKAAARRGDAASRAEGEADLLAKISAMPEPDRSMAARLHELMKTTAPELSPKTWYGMPAYANENGEVVCFFQNASKFKARYSTLGFSDKAKLDEGHLWATSFALEELTSDVEARIAELVKKAVTQ